MAKSKKRKRVISLRRGWCSGLNQQPKNGRCVDMITGKRSRSKPIKSRCPKGYIRGNASLKTGRKVKPFCFDPATQHSLRGVRRAAR